MKINSPERVMVVALDAAECSLIERWIQDGSLPNLHGFRSQGVYGRLESTAGWLSGSPWPTFHTGTLPSQHGIYSFLQWRPERMAIERPNPAWLPFEPFWRDLAGRGRRTLILDLPMAYTPQPFEGIEISGYATHDHLDRPGSYPRDALPWVKTTFGPSHIQQEVYGLQSADSLLSLRDQILDSTRKVAAVGEALMSREDWSLFMVGFTGTHRAGHKLWDGTGVIGEVSPSKAQELARSLREVYRACDDALGRLARAAGPGTTILVMSLHGMGPNTSRVEVMDEMLERILGNQDGRLPQKTRAAGMLRRLRDRIPVEWRHALKRRLPVAVQDGLSAYWRLGRVDWTATRAMSLVADNLGYIRINLKGRERLGIVDPNDEYHAIFELLSEGLRTFLDADSGRPVVDEIAGPADLYGHGPRTALLPDLLVRWAESPASAHRRIESSCYASILWPTPGRHPSGRSGNHRPEGFLLAVGPGIPHGDDLKRAHIVDLAPTIYALLGLAGPPGAQGKALDQFQRPGTPQNVKQGFRDA
jgi:predicted AlkP superfamily phosphohydrolase/phosphomutase